MDEGGGCTVHTRGGRYHGTLLLEACRWHKPKVVAFLLERGVDVNASGGGLWSPLHYACDGRETPGLAVTLIEHGATVDAGDYHHRTPLHLACRNGFFDVAVVLLEGGADPNVEDLNGRTPVHYAAFQGSRDLIALLASYGGDVSSRDWEGETPLHKATRGGHAVAMNILQRAGADPEAANCWCELAGTLALSFKMNPPSTEERGGEGGSVVEGAGAVCSACSAKDGRHYYFCKSEFLQEVPDSRILGPDGLPVDSKAASNRGG
ncbi:unnamed protein product [Discosporangium mesarthrocarpum]